VHLVFLFKHCFKKLALAASETELNKNPYLGSVGECVHDKKFEAAIPINILRSGQMVQGLCASDARQRKHKTPDLRHVGEYDAVDGWSIWPQNGE
jgi:hypothetical protein